MAEIDLNDLADRVERLDGPCREMDLHIACVLDRRSDWLSKSDGEMWVDTSGLHPVIRFADARIGRSLGNPSVDDPPKFTASIDAAMTLVPEGMEVSVHWRKGDSYVGRAMVAVPFSTEAVGRICATLAIALTACALRARLMEGEGEK